MKDFQVGRRPHKSPAIALSRTLHSVVCSVLVPAVLAARTAPRGPISKGGQTTWNAILFKALFPK